MGDGKSREQVAQRRQILGGRATSHAAVRFCQEIDQHGCAGK